MAATDEMVRIAKEIRPEMVTLVPEKRQDLTTEGGLDIVSLRERIAAVTQELQSAGIGVSLFIDPVNEQVVTARSIGADMIEIHTGAFSDALTDAARMDELKRIVVAAQKGKGLGLGVNAGHGLHYHNVKEIAAIPEIDELAIGHSIIARALFVGLDRAVRDMIALIQGTKNSF
jgi:pyridoxine 5-phosphate synthase